MVALAKLIVKVALCGWSLFISVMLTEWLIVPPPIMAVIYLTAANGCDSYCVIVMWSE